MESKYKANIRKVTILEEQPFFAPANSHEPNPNDDSFNFENYELENCKEDSLLDYFSEKQSYHESESSISSLHFEGLDFTTQTEERPDLRLDEEIEIEDEEY